MDRPRADSPGVGRLRPRGALSHVRAVRLDPATEARLRAVAGAAGVTPSLVIRRAVEAMVRWLERRTPSP